MTKKAAPEEPETRMATTTKFGEVVPASELPAYLKADHRKQLGLEETTKDDFVYPRLGLAQALSPQLKRSNALYLEGLGEGDLFNTVTGEIYGDTVQLIPLFFFRTRIKFIPMDQGGGMDCQSMNGKTGGRLSPESCVACPHSQWRNATKEGDKNEPPECDEFKNFMTMLYPSGELIVLSAKRTSLGVAKKINTLARMKNLPLFSTVYEIGHAHVKKTFEWEQLTVKPVTLVPEALYEQAKAYFDALHEAGVEFDTRGEQDKEAEDNDRDERM